MYDVPLLVRLITLIYANWQDLFSYDIPGGVTCTVLYTNYSHIQNTRFSGPRLIQIPPRRDVRKAGHEAAEHSYGHRLVCSEITELFECS